MQQRSVRFHAIGHFSREQVVARWVDDSRPRFAEAEAAIDLAWKEANARPGVRLFDLPMCRLESFEAGERLYLNLSPTSYRIFVGTHYNNPDLAERFGPTVLANALGMSAIVRSADGMIVMGRRSESVAHYPRRVHTFGGTLEPPEAGNVFAAIGRELAEELRLTSEHISDIHCMGLIEDRSIRQPELVFFARSNLTAARIEQNLDEAEHTSLFLVEAQADTVAETAAMELLTPVASAAMLLGGRELFGEPWFDATAKLTNLG